MRALLFALPALASLSFALPGQAQEAPSPGQPATSGTSAAAPAANAPPAKPQAGETPLKPVEDAASRGRHLDELFAKLKQEASPAKAESIAGEINAEWLESGSATVDLLVQRAALAIAKEDRSAAYDFLDQAIGLDPNFAEAWNRRATLNYAADDYGKSLDDIRATLRLEPRHYGALMGLGAILEETDRKEQALEAYSRALEVYPTLKAAQDAVSRLSDDLVGQSL